jgi:gentisate 1,2-dioxygenase
MTAGSIDTDESVLLSFSDRPVRRVFSIDRDQALDARYLA